MIAFPTPLEAPDQLIDISDDNATIEPEVIDTLVGAEHLVILISSYVKVVEYGPYSPCPLAPSLGLLTTYV